MTDEFEGARWFKGSGSNDSGCVEVAFGSRGSVGVRDTKDRSKPAHVYTAHEWDLFIAGAKAGEFDRPE